MYQGNTYHRGDRQQPGRVATLVQDEDSFAERPSAAFSNHRALLRILIALFRGS
ncbi:unnamed protein product [Haemonchus placei]|uniref:Uncharacterized protein n=1 Tax=Haemonchus placei TaxID=6290 RepID=A0A0N4WVB9_HAEPC|nr:unnamed protein product [Haemonchus placei]